MLDAIDRDEQETAIKVIDALIGKHRVEETVGRRRLTDARRLRVIARGERAGSRQPKT